MDARNMALGLDPFPSVEMEINSEVQRDGSSCGVFVLMVSLKFKNCNNNCYNNVILNNLILSSVFKNNMLPYFYEPTLISRMQRRSWWGCPSMLYNQQRWENTVFLSQIVCLPVQSQMMIGCVTYLSASDQ